MNAQSTVTVDVKANIQDIDKKLAKQERAVKTLDGAVNVLGGSVELLAGGLGLVGALSEEQAKAFEGAAVSAIAFADGAKRVIDGYKSLTEVSKLLKVAKVEEAAAETIDTTAKAANTTATVANTTATEAATVAQLELNTAILANPYFLAAAAVAGLVAAIVLFTGETDKAVDASNEIKDAIKEANKAAGNEIVTLKQNVAIIEDKTRSDKERKAALDELKKTFPGYFQDLKDEEILNGNARIAVEDLTKAILAKARAQAAEKKLAELASAELDLLDEQKEAQENLNRAIRVQNSLREDARTGQLGIGANAATQGQSGRIQAQTNIVNDLTDALEANRIKQQELADYVNKNQIETGGVFVPPPGGGGDDGAAQKALERRLKAIDILTEAELSKLDDRNRELLEREMRYEEDKKALIAAGFDDFQALDEEYRLDQLAIQQKYDEQDQAARDAADAKELAKEKEKQDLLNRIADAEAITDEQKYLRKLQITAQYYDDLIAEAKKAGLDVVELEKAKDAALDQQQKEHNAKSLEEQKAYRQQLQDLVLGSALSLISDLKSLNQIYDKDNEKAARRAFNRDKALASVETVISTYLAAQKAYASQMTLTPDAPIRAQIAAAVAVASGLARLAVINSQQFKSTGTASGQGNAGGGAGSGAGSNIAGNIPPANVSGTITPRGLTIGTGTNAPIGAEPIRAYVLTGDVATGLNAEGQIRRRRRLGG